MMTVQPVTRQGEGSKRWVTETFALASMMDGGTPLLERCADQIHPSDFDGTNRIVCEVLLAMHRRRCPIDDRSIELMFYAPGGAVDIQGLLYLYESLRTAPIRPSLDTIEENLLELIAALHRIPTALYFWYDADDVLLYIGITGDLATRQSSHAKRSSWSEFADHSKIRRFPSRPEAEAAEKAAIEAERPLFNHVHNDTPEARQRLVAYLIEHGRADLLTPAVSRG